MKRLAWALLTLCAFVVPAGAVDIREVTSPGGIRAWLVEERSIPFVALELRFRGGTSLDPEGKRGAINLMTALLEEGAGDRDARAFAEARDDLAASFDFDVWDDALTVSARFLTENRSEAVALLETALTQPRFDEDALERVRAQVLSIIQSDLKDPNHLAGRGFDSLAFGAHPYGTDRNGSAETVAALTREDMAEAAARVLARDRIYVSAVGDIGPEELGALLDDLLGDLPATGAEMPRRAEFLLAPGVTVEDFDTPQSVVSFGHIGIRRDDPDFFAAFVMNQILGGSGFAARLMDEVREKRGLTYGISTYLVPLDLAETYQGAFASSNDKVAEAIAVVRAEWARLAGEGVGQAELAAAKTYLTGSYPLRFDGNAPIAKILVGMQMEGLPITYVNTRNAQIEAVTLDDVRRVATRVMRPEALHFYVVGKPEGLATGD